MSYGFLPNADADLLAWATTFASGIAIDPASLGLSAEQADAFEALRAAFAATLPACEPRVRNSVSVAAKNAAREPMKACARRLASIIKGQANVTDVRRMELGLNVRTTGAATPVPGRASVKIVGVSGRTVTVHLGLAESTAGPRGLPWGAQGAIVWTHVGPTAPETRGEWTFHGVVGRATVELTFDGATPPGATVWVTATLFNRRKENGPAAYAVSTTLAGGIGGVGPGVAVARPRRAA